jgi:YbbR domain-containing protein
MFKNVSVSRAVLENVMWFAGSLVLAFFVWVIATSEADPIQERRFPNVPVQITVDDGLLITNDPRNTATVTVRAQQSVLNLLTVDDIVVQADLSGHEAGTDVIELQARIAPGRPARVVDTSPRQLTVTLEMIAQRFIPLRAAVESEPPPGFRYDPPVFDVPQNQVLVSGAASKVELAVAAQAELDLNDQRNPLETDVALTVVDVNGDPVTDVTIEPPIVHVQVNIQRRNDVREVSVSPNILVDTLPTGYVLTSISYNPQVILVSGSPEQMRDIPDTLATAPIDLTNRTDDFEITVPVDLPQEGFLLVGNQNITVSVEIEARTANRQFDGIPVEITGLSEGYTAQIAPDEVTVLVTGPQPVLETLASSDIQVTVDLNGLLEGNYQLIPQVTITRGETLASNISVLPTEIDVQVVVASDENSR